MSYLSKTTQAQGLCECGITSFKYFSYIITPLLEHNLGCTEEPPLTSLCEFTKRKHYLQHVAGGIESASQNNFIMNILISLFLSKHLII